MLKKAIFAATLAFIPIVAMATADGPDAWRVSGVSSWDTLSVRIGPGTKYFKIGDLAHNTRHLRYTECVPYIDAGVWERLSNYQRDHLPARWCMIYNPRTGVSGWVAGKYLRRPLHNRGIP